MELDVQQFWYHRCHLQRFLSAGILQLLHLFMAQWVWRTKSQMASPLLSVSFFNSLYVCVEWSFLTFLKFKTKTRAHATAKTAASFSARSWQSACLQSAPLRVSRLSRITCSTSGSLGNRLDTSASTINFSSLFFRAQALTDMLLFSN